MPTFPIASKIDLATAESFYRDALASLRDAKVPFLIAGAYAFENYSGISRRTKDIDIFARQRDVDAILEVLGGRGYRTEITDPSWLAKAFATSAAGAPFIDIIFNSGNGLAPVDDVWFDYAIAGTVLGMPMKLGPPEESIWQKAFIMERERYDGADVAHLILVLGRQLDWSRLVQRFGAQWRVLLSHLVLFGFIYPEHRAVIPAAVMGELLARLQGELRTPAPADHRCNGTLLSRAQYNVDIEQWGYSDPRPFERRD